MALPAGATLLGQADLTALRTMVGVSDAVWTSFCAQVGDPGNRAAHLAALPPWIIQGACSQAQFPDGGGLTPVHASQVGLLWRVARKYIFLHNGGQEEEYVDIEPWSNPNQALPAAVPTPVTKTSTVKEQVLKMASILDQSDESELLPAPTDKLQEWLQRYTSLMGALPEEEEEPSDGQLAALYRRVVTLGQPPYTDFSVWTPFSRRALRTQKYRTYIPLGDGSFMMRELPGPQNFLQWLACWRVFKVAALSLGIVSLAALQQYEKVIEKLTTQCPQAWGLVAQADDKGRAEKLEKIRRGVLADKALGRSLPAGWDEDDPWTHCFQALSKDEVFWAEQVRHPATVWIASGGRGAPIAPSEAIAATHLAGGTDVVLPQKEDRDDRKKQANRDKRAARKKRVRDEREELSNFRNQKSSTAHGPPAGKGPGKGKPKVDKVGAELCYSWAQGSGTCADVPVGGECKGKVKRSHKCQICLSPGHRNDACPQK